MKITVVCTGNTCRSPMAAALLGSLLSEAEVSSAGIYAENGAPASENAVAAMAARGVDISSHRARKLTGADAEADMVICMTRRHKAAVKAMFPGARAYTLTELAGEYGDVPDPYGGGPAEYESCAGELERLTNAAAAAIKRGIYR